MTTTTIYPTLETKHQTAYPKKQTHRKAHPLVLLAVFLLSMTGIISPLSAQVPYGEDESRISFPINPQKNRGFIAWLPPKGKSTENWDVEVLERGVDARGTTTWTTLESFSTEKTFFHLEKNYLDQQGTYLKVSAPGMAAELIEVGDIRYQTNGATFDHKKVWKCNGPNYAWELNLYEKQSNSMVYLNMNSTEQTYDEVNDIAVPFMQYFAYSVFANNVPLQAEAINTNTTNLSYFDAQGNPLSGVIWAIPKGLGQYADFPKTTPLMIQGAIDATYSRTAAIFVFNNNAVFPFGNHPLLECIPTPSTGAGGWINPTPLVINTSLLNKIKITLWGYDFVGWDDGIKDPGGNDLLGLPVSTDPFYTPDADPSEEGISAGDYTHFAIMRLDGKMDPLFLDPAEIYKSDGSIQYPTLDLQTGLYKMVMYLKDGRHIPFMFSYEKGGAAHKQMTQVDLFEETNMSIYPVPVTGNEYSVRIKPASDQEGTLKVMDLNGSVYFEEALSLKANTSTTRRVSFMRSNYPPYGILVNHLILEDGYTKVIKVVLE